MQIQKKYLELNPQYDAEKNETSLTTLEFYVSYDEVDAAGMPIDPKIEFKGGNQAVPEVLNGKLTAEEVFAYGEQKVEQDWTLIIGVPYTRVGDISQTKSGTE